MEAKVIVDALKMALKARVYKHKFVHHSDRGLQYCSREYTAVAIRNNLHLSMTENGDPYENALAERVNRTIKEEFLLDELNVNKADMIKMTHQAISIYNTRRPHLSPNYNTPASVHRRKNPGRK